MLILIDFYAENPIVGKTLISCYLTDTNVYDDINGNGESSFQIQNTNDLKVKSDRYLYLQGDDGIKSNSSSYEWNVYGQSFWTFTQDIEINHGFPAGPTPAPITMYFGKDPSSIYGEVYVRFQGANSIKIPGGTNGQVLTTDGSSNLSWTTVSGGSGLDVSNFVFNEIVTPTTDPFFQSLIQYFLAYTPITNTTQVFINGLLQTINVDYTVSGNAINFVNTPLPTDTIVVHYIK